MEGVVNCAAYAAGRRVADVEVKQISEVLKQEDQFIRIGLHEPNEDLLRQVQQEFGLHDLAIEDAHSVHQRPKLERYDDSLFVVLRTAQMQKEQTHIHFGETHIFISRPYFRDVYDHVIRINEMIDTTRDLQSMHGCRPSIKGRIRRRN